MTLPDNELEALYQRLVKALNPEEIFGSLDGLDREGKLAAISKSYRYLAKAVHPDLYREASARIQHIAQEAFKEVNDLYHQAENKVKNGSFGLAEPTPASPTDAETVTMGGWTYTLDETEIEGDYCRIRKAVRRSRGKATETVVIKTVIDDTDNDLLQNEAEILTLVSHKSLPIFLDTLLSEGKRSNVLRWIEGMDLVTLMSHFPEGLPQEHMVWILDRLLSVLGFLHVSKIIHGAIEPANIMIMPRNHNGLLIDLTLGVQNANLTGAHFHGLNDYSAPEIVEHPKMAPRPSADLYSLGLSMIKLVGGDIKTQRMPGRVDGRIQEFLMSLCQIDPQERANDAWASWHELKVLRQQVFGAANQFLPLHV